MNESQTLTRVLSSPTVLPHTWVLALMYPEGGVHRQCLVAALASLCLCPSRSDGSPGSSRDAPPSGVTAPSCRYGESAGHRLAGMTRPQPRGCRTLLIFSLGDLGFHSASAAHPSLSKTVRVSVFAFLLILSGV